MSRLLSPWETGVIEKLRLEHPIDETLRTPHHAKWLIHLLARKQVPFRVVNLGAGVRRILSGPNVDVCKKCNGTGKVVSGAT